ncbi:MAG: hypothetical protein ACI8RD_003542 [Bacillariaceae sp.]|jgi:hypothetical protein
MLTHNILPRDKGFRQFYSFYKNFLTRRAEDGPEEKTKLVVGLCYIFFAEILTILTEMLLPHQFLCVHSTNLQAYYSCISKSEGKHHCFTLEVTTGGLM